MPIPNIENEAAKHLIAYTSQTIISAELFLQRLQTIRENNYVFCNQEFRETITGIGAPVFDEKGEVIASISITSSPKRVTSPVTQKSYIAAVKEAAQQMTNIVTMRKRGVSTQWH